MAQITSPTNQQISTGLDDSADMNKFDLPTFTAGEVSNPDTGFSRWYFNGTTGVIRFPDGSELVLGGGNVQKSFYEGMSSTSLVKSDFLEEPAFLQTEGLRSVAAGAGAGVAGVAGLDVTNHPGVWAIDTGTTATGRTFLISQSPSSYHIGVGGITRFGAWVQVPVLSTAVQRFVVRAGLSSISLPNTINHGITFEYQDDQNGGRWQGVTNATGESSLDTGTAVVAGTWYNLEWECNAAGTSVEFFIDGSSVGTLSTAADIPSGSGFNMFTNIHIMKLVGTTDRKYYVDAYYVYQELTR